MPLIRLDKYLSDALGLSRREAKALLGTGHVLLDGRAATRGDEKLDPLRDTVALDGRVLSVPEKLYLMLNKPAGVLTATTDSRQPTVLDLLSVEYRRKRLFPVGRLDRDTTGLLLLTDDGDFAHRIISPKSRVPKLYEAEVSGTLGEEDVRAFTDGLTLSDGTRCLPAELTLLGGDTVRVEVCEGRYHQVKRMLASRGAPVRALRRLRIGGLWLDTTLMAGEHKILSDAERDSALYTK